MNRTKISPAMLVALLALVVALAGATTAGYAAGKASGNSLIKKSSLSGNRLKADTVTGKQVAEGSLGTVPTATRADRATVADQAASAQRTPLSAPVLLTPGPGWEAAGAGFAPAGYRVDSSGFVHLQGTMTRASGVSGLIATLPAGVRPATTIDAPIITFSGTPGGVDILPSGEITLFGGDADFVSLEGVTFLPA